jgi:hypothetical protein
MNFKHLKTVGIAATAAGFLAAASPSIDTKQATPASKPAGKALATPDAAPDAAKLEAIKKMLAVSGTVAGNVEGTHEAIKAMIKNSPGISPEFWVALKKCVSHEAFEHMLVAVYDRTYTLDQINDLTKFYESPTGKAFLLKNGKALSESGRILQAYMERNAKELMKKYGQQAPKADPKKP